MYFQTDILSFKKAFKYILYVCDFYLEFFVYSFRVNAVLNTILFETIITQTIRTHTSFYINIYMCIYCEKNMVTLADKCKTN